MGNSTRKFNVVDDYVRERLARFLAKKQAKVSKHHRKRYTWAFFNELGVYQLTGTVKWYTAAPTAVR